MQNPVVDFGIETVFVEKHFFMKIIHSLVIILFRECFKNDAKIHYRAKLKGGTRSVPPFNLFGHLLPT